MDRAEEKRNAHSGEIKETVHQPQISSQIFGNPASDRLILQILDLRRMQRIDYQISMIRTLAGTADFCLVSLTVENWFHDLSPWKNSSLTGEESFGDGAGETLKTILEKTLPEILSDLPENKERRIFLAGYSLAGLFTLWAGYQSERFAGIAAISPAVWLPGWTRYIHREKMQTPMVYLSIGDLEGRPSNPVFSGTGTAIRLQKELLESQGIKVAFELNPGNHFVHTDERLAGGVAWLLRSDDEERRKKMEHFRPMRRDRQALLGDECREILLIAKRGILSLCGDDGYPYGIPMNYVYERGHIYFHGARQGHKIDALNRSDKVCFTVLSEGVREEGSWWYHYKSVVVFGRIRLVTDPKERDAALILLGKKYFPDEAWLQKEMSSAGNAQVLDLCIEHLSGKRVREK